MKFIVYSLGNVGDKYIKTRHNAGRIVCDNINWDEANNIINSDLSKIRSNENISIEYVVPDTYMNETGKFLLHDIKYRNILPTNIIIVYDDIDINFGEVKLSFDRSSGGHNGVESVINELGTKEFYRIRIGIGEKINKEMLLQDYVMSNLKSEELTTLKSDILKKEILLKIEEVIKMTLC